MYLGKSRDRSGDDDTGGVSGNTDHGQTGVLEFLHGHVFLLCVGHLGPVVRPVEAGFLVDFTREGLSFHLSAVLDSLNDGAENDELGPPLVVGGPEGFHGIGGLDGSLEGPDLRKGPSNGGQHSRTSVGELGLAEVVDGCPLGQFERIELGMESTKQRR